MKKYKLIATVFCLFIIFSAQAKNRKAVFIIVDGIPADVIERVHTPNIDEISSAGGYARASMGGKVNDVTQTPTISAVCYNTLLTSTWANKHNVWGNGIEAPNYNYWNIFRIAENQKRKVDTAIYSTWLDNRTKLVGDGLQAAGGIHIDRHLDGLELDKSNYPAETNNLQIFKIDETISKAAAESIRQNGPDLTWVYLQYTDDAGHKFGNGEKFDSFVDAADKQVGRIWEAVKERQKTAKEEWLIVVVTDHGRNNSGYGHGGQTERERTIWISMNQKPNPYFNKGQASMVDILPTICRFMNFSIPKEVSYEEEGMPLIGKISFSNLEMKRNEGGIELSWKAYDNAPLEIFVSTTNHYKEGQTDNWKKVGRVRASEGKFTFPCAKDEYCKISVRGTKNNGTVSIK